MWSPAPFGPSVQPEGPLIFIDGYPSMNITDGYPSMNIIDGYPSMDIIDGNPSMIFIDGYPSMDIDGYPVL